MGPSPTPADFARSCARAADAKQAEDVLVLDVGEVLAVCDYFVVASGRTDRQVRAIVDAVESSARADFDRRPRSTEGRDTLRWVLLDYGDVVVHVFHSEDRDLYRLERLFSDVDTVDWAELTPG